MLSSGQNIFYFIFAFLIIIFSVGIIVVGIIVIHDLPYKIACKQNHPQKNAIRCMSIMGLILFPLWLLAMIWAYIVETKVKDLPALESTTTSKTTIKNNTPKESNHRNKEKIQISKKIPTQLKVNKKTTETNIKPDKIVTKIKAKQESKES
jgi:hypothetical protein